jgi:hypothetical protein
VIFCKSRKFLGETEETLKSHVSFVNSVFGAELRQTNDVLNMVWLVAGEHPEILYMVGHTGDALNIINQLHNLCELGIGTQIKDIYLNTCTSKPADANSVEAPITSGIVPASQATEEEKKKIGIRENKFVTLDGVFEKVKSDGFRIHLCHQDTVTDVNVRMAHFLPMDECGLGFSPTKSELLLYNHKGSLSEKLSAAFEETNK